MKRIHQTTWLVLCLSIASTCGVVGWILYTVLLERSPETYARWLDVDPNTFANVDVIAESDLIDNAYNYDANKYADAIPGATRVPKVANEKGLLPVFKIDSDVFVITHKWVNASAGLAISESQDFANRVDAMSHGFRVWRISDGVFGWNLDLDEVD